MSDNITINDLTEEERQLALSILKQMQEEESKGEVVLHSLIDADWKEKPVDILTFVDDNYYLGEAWHDAYGKSKMFPYWRDVLVKLFPDEYTTAQYNTAIFSGARGLGKSEIAVLCCEYMMHRVMCMRDPHVYYNIKKTEKLCFAFMNITADLAEEIATSKFQKSVQMSPWFMERGTITGRDNLQYVPPEPISIIIGSQPRHVIGLPILFCLDGDTVINTFEGDRKIKDLVDEKINVNCVGDDGQIIKSDDCTVKVTGYFQEEYHIELEDGTILKCTPNHRFMLTDGTYKEARYLTEEDELMDIKPFGYIYKITNEINGKVYIGQSVNVNKRFKEHIDASFNPNHEEYNYKLCRSIRKYGKDCFTLDIIDTCFTKSELNEKEIYYIKLYNSTVLGYNIATGGQGGNLGPEVCKKISESLKGCPKDIFHCCKISHTIIHKHGNKYRYPIISEIDRAQSRYTRYKQKQLLEKYYSELFTGKPMPQARHEHCMTDEGRKVLADGARERINNHNPVYDDIPNRLGSKNPNALICTCNGMTFGCMNDLYQYLIQSYPDLPRSLFYGVCRNTYKWKCKKYEKFKFLIGAIEVKHKYED